MKLKTRLHHSLVMKNPPVLIEANDTESKQEDFYGKNGVCCNKDVSCAEYGVVLSDDGANCCPFFHLFPMTCTFESV